MYTEPTKTVNEMTLNELVKLTTLWTTGPRLPLDIYSMVAYHFKAILTFWNRLNLSKLIKYLKKYNFAIRG